MKISLNISLVGNNFNTIYTQSSCSSIPIGKEWSQMYYVSSNIGFQKSFTSSYINYMSKSFKLYKSISYI